MLVLTRRVGETLIIGDNVKLTIVGVKSGQVRVGIDAPKEIQIQREELLLKQDKNSEDASSSSDENS
ncbi:carbon storage regulator CsrA [Hydrogenovibrio sp. JE_KL2]|jgi:carbon storage regulator|uniref:carbon storage regulator CsrA n=1 Tax=Hydrogenovibrio sp. JE_KL2 TaxID=2651188 RepID=UPI00128B12D4|nr:carbon storage regulator CsrA [Hydrogenovibrio sp. JE_KL2]MBD3821373.1 carbon storage regulator CsrA [Thiotrichales bacterium]MBN2606678.1 carbon storage regulator CsrA [Thiotrichales bacterium]MPQ76885.1 carbon storage regulator CsrA [Hydrogenovibrio sp. JE_KL2]